MQVVGYGEDDIMQLQMLFEPLWDCFVAHNRTNDVTCYGTCRIAVAIVVDGRNKNLLETINMTGNGVNGNS